MENVTNVNETKMKNKNMIWKVIKWTIIMIVSLFAILVAIRVFVLTNTEKVEAKVNEIHGIRLTLADVDGSKLPPMPNEEINNSTVEGVDINKNYVRDDVERWIFETYPNLEERAAWMQWAKAKNLVMLKATNKMTLKAIMEEGSRANICSVETYLKTGKSDSSIYDKREKNLFDIAINTEIRKKALEKGYSYMTSSGPIEGQQCDVDFENE